MVKRPSAASPPQSLSTLLFSVTSSFDKFSMTPVMRSPTTSLAIASWSSMAAMAFSAVKMSVGNRAPFLDRLRGPTLLRPFMKGNCLLFCNSSRGSHLTTGEMDFRMALNFTPDRPTLMWVFLGTCGSKGTLLLLSCNALVEEGIFSLGLIGFVTAFSFDAEAADAITVSTSSLFMRTIVPGLPSSAVSFSGVTPTRSTETWQDRRLAMVSMRPKRGLPLLRVRR